MTIDYIAATPADQAIIDAAGGSIYKIPNGQIASVSLKPVLRVNAEDRAVGVAGVGMGIVHNSDIHFLAPTNQYGLPQNVVPAIYNTIVCGAAQVIGFGIEGSSESMLNPPVDPEEDTEGLASLLHNTAMDYLANCRNADLELGRLMHDYVTTGVTDAIVENVVNVLYDYYSGAPVSFDWVGLRVDADRSVLGIWPVDRYNPPDPETRDFMIIAGLEGSLYESRIYEDSYGQESISTAKLLQLAIDEGITVYKRWSSLPLPGNTQPSHVRNAIQNAILNGHEVTFPADPITVGDAGTGQWTGTAWIDMTPSSGAAGYIISGNNNGGATYEEWPPVFINLAQYDNVTCIKIKIKGGNSPQGDSPHQDAVFTRRVEQHLTFEYQIEVTYQPAARDTLDIAILPSPTTHYERTTQNTTKTFVPGNYVFSVWLTGYYGLTCPDAILLAQRKISIIGCLIREDDGSEFGRNPPKCVPVLPPDTPPFPSRNVMAVVIPSKAPDGSDLIASPTSYAWTGKGDRATKLVFIPPNKKKVVIQPNTAEASTAPNDQIVEVKVNLVHNKHVYGYCKFNYAQGSRDYEHKMTVYAVELKAEDGTDDPPKYVATEKKDKIKALLKPTGVEGKFENWETTSTKVTLRYPPAGALGKDQVEVEAGENPSEKADDEEIVPVFRPKDALEPDKFPAHKMTVVKAELVVHKPPNIDPGEAEIPEDDKLTKGAQTFVNLDNDDDDTRWDTGTTDTNVAGENDMIKTEIRLQPNDITEGDVKVEATAGPGNILVWKKNNKDTQYTLGTNLSVSDVNVFKKEGDVLVAKLWVEGITPHTAQRGTRLKMTYDEPKDCEDEVAITIIGIDSIVWIGRNNSRNNNNALDADPSWPAGVNPGSLRVFPGARAAGAGVEAGTRNQVDIKATLTVDPVRPVRVYFDSFDVDDPTSAAAPVDNEANDEDNRGTAPAKSGKFVGEAAGLKTETFNTKEKTFRFEVTMQPGDNFRVVGTGDLDFLADLENKDNAGANNNDKQRITNKHVGGTLTQKEIREPAHYASNVLTVWRFCHMEIDSMGAVVNNYQEGNITALNTGDSSTAKRVTVSTSPRDGSRDLNSAPAGNGRFETGTLRVANTHNIGPLTGNGQNDLRRAAGINVCATALPFSAVDNDWWGNGTMSGTVTKITNNSRRLHLNITAHNETPIDWPDFVGGTVKIGTGPNMSITAVDAANKRVTVAGLLIPYRVDDDDMANGTDVAGPDLSRLVPAFAPAYVLPLTDAGTADGALTFHPHMETRVANSGPAVRVGWKFDASAQEANSRYWCLYIRGSFQDSVAQDDNDPNGSVTWGIVDDINGQGANIYKEVFTATEHAIFPAIDEDDTVVHEVGHLFNGLHADGGVMSGGGVAGGPDFSNTTLNRIRSISHP